MSLKLKSSESTCLKFGVNIYGTDIEPKLRFIIETDLIQYMFLGSLEDGNAIINIPRLDTILEKIDVGSYNAKVEVILNDNYYEPWNGVIDIENPVEVEISSDLELTEKETTKEIKVQLLEIKEIKNTKDDTIDKTVVPVITPKKRRDAAEIMEELL